MVTCSNVTQDKGLAEGLGWDQGTNRVCRADHKVQGASRIQGYKWGAWGNWKDWGGGWQGLWRGTREQGVCRGGLREKVGLSGRGEIRRPGALSGSMRWIGGN